MRYLACSMLVATMLGAGCSGGGGDDPDKGLPPDTRAVDQGPPPCGPNIYPCGPYGYNKDNVAANIDFLGYSDPKEHCKAHPDKIMDSSKQRRISFQDYHLGDPSTACASHKRQLLWVMVSAGWCVPCQKELLAIQNKYSAGTIDNRLGIVNVVFETESKGVPVTDAFIKKWISDFKMTLPAAMDPTFKMGKYFDKKATPFNMLVDTKTMKIYYRTTGYDEVEFQAQIDAFLK